MTIPEKYEKDYFIPHSVLPKNIVAWSQLAVLCHFGKILSIPSVLQWVHLPSDWPLWNFSGWIFRTQKNHPLPPLERRRVWSSAKKACLPKR